MGKMKKATKDYMLELLSNIIGDIENAREFPEGDALYYAAKEAEALYLELREL